VADGATHLTSPQHLIGYSIRHLEESRLFLYLDSPRIIGDDRNLFPSLVVGLVAAAVEVGVVAVDVVAADLVAVVVAAAVVATVVV